MYCCMAYLGVFEPLLILLQRDLPRLALRFFLSGPLTPGVDRSRSDLSGLRPSKPLLVLPAVDLVGLGHNSKSL